MRSSAFRILFTRFACAWVLLTAIEFEYALSAAGFYDAYALDMYVGIRVLLPVAAVALVSFFTTGFAIILGVASAGCLIPDFVLERLVKKRRNKIRRSLPDTVDLLVICMDAGLGVDQAVQRTAGVLDIAYPGSMQRITASWSLKVAR